MLSIANVGNGKAAANYYEAADDYYTKDHAPSSWWGIGAELLGLTEGVEPAMFSDLLDGKLPGGEHLHNAAAGRRGGTDLTFSAPKSVSLQVLVGGDNRILNAHKAAVSKALEYAECFAACRVTENGITRSESTGNLVVARFEHDLSRACDPQLHTHCVAINATRRSDGQWRAMDNQPLYRMKMLLGVMYRAELARELQLLGYDIRLTHADGRFELGHIDDHQVRAFSQRSQVIEDWLQENKGISRDDASAWDKKLIAVVTRERKTDIDREFLRCEWGKLSLLSGIDYVPEWEFSFSQTVHDISGALDDAISHLEERESVFDHRSLLQATLERSVGTATLLEIESAIIGCTQSGGLIQCGDRYTTSAAQKLENEILTVEVKSRGVLQPVYSGSSEDLRDRIQQLNHGQQDAVIAMMLTQTQVLGIQGRAGAGKTTLLKSASRVAEECGYKLKGLAPSASAARELGGAGVEAETITAFMHRKFKGIDNKTILLVDEAGMASTRQMHAILNAAINRNCRVVLIGDTQQLKAVEAGKPFAQLQGNGMHTAIVDEIQRQKNSTLKLAVELSVSGQVALAVELLDKKIAQIRDSSARFDQIASDYIGFSPQERDDIRVVAGTRYARAEINNRIREHLGLNGIGVEFGVLDRKDMTRAQSKSTLSYQPGDIVQAEKKYPSLGLKRGDLATVVKRGNGAIVLERSDGAHMKWRPALAPNFSAYTAVKRELSVGDLIRFTSNNHSLGVINGDMGKVIAIDTQRQQLTVEYSDGQSIALDTTRPLMLDYGYCSTVHAAQGQTCDRVLIEADTNSLTANESTFYVAISRARHEALIYTDDREMLPLAMSREYEKSSALELDSGRQKSYGLDVAA